MKLANSGRKVVTHVQKCCYIKFTAASLSTEPADHDVITSPENLRRTQEVELSADPAGCC